MWKDLGLWGLIVGIAAILLTVPLSMLGNILTPRFLNWWSERSVSSLSRRIMRLERQLAETRKLPPISDGEEQILRTVTWIGITLVQLIGMSMVSIGGLLIYAIFRTKGYEKYLNDGIAAVGLITSAFILNMMASSIEYLRKRSRLVREALANEIIRLKSKVKKH